MAIDDNDIAEVVSVWTKIPLSKLQEGESERLLKLEDTLHERVIGQSEAVTAVAKAVRRGRVGLKDPNRPIGSFLFLGPTGVGKTELSKALAYAMFGSESSLIRVDMSEFMEKHTVSKLIGSPPGYVGYDEGGQMSEKVRRNPYSVILFDEVEKAHPDIFNVLLQVLDDGRITDSTGRVIDFKNTVIIMTSNAGASNIVEPKNLGFMAAADEKQNHENMKNKVMDEVKRIFKPEFINRIDDIIVFHTLNKEDIGKIVDIMIGTLNKRIYEQMKLSIELDDSARNHLIKKGYDTKYGARPLRRTIQNEVENVLAEKILEGSIKAGNRVLVTCDGDKLTFTLKRGHNR
jgi:ATP-dependent Clp protease ATP-binding subunit ClpC